MLRKLALRFSIIPLMMVIAVGCAKKKKTEDQSMEAVPSVQTGENPNVESTPMSFDAAGSDSGRIDGLNTVFFDYDKSTLNAESKRVLQANATWIKAHDNVKIQIEGHCDARGSLEYNLALGERRANSVKSYLTSIGIPGSRIVVISFGKEKPLVNGDSEEAYAKNRRANFVPMQ
jgi:peptidoglycan-associated lipoprotein